VIKCSWFSKQRRYQRERSIRKRYDGTFKVQVVLIFQWKKQLLEKVPKIFSRKRNQKEKAIEEKETKLYRQIGQLKVELDWVKRNLDSKR